MGLEPTTSCLQVGIRVSRASADAEDIVGIPDGCCRCPEEFGLPLGPHRLRGCARVQLLTPRLPWYGVHAVRRAALRLQVRHNSPPVPAVGG